MQRLIVTGTVVCAAAALIGGCAHAPLPEADAQRLAAAVRARPLVLLGEVHDNERQHTLRAQALRALLDGGARPALLMEQFDRERQAELDRALAAPGATPDDVIRAASPPAPAPQSGWRWSLYRPFIALALDYRLPIVAVNVSRVDARRVSSEGLTALGFDAGVAPDIEATQARAIVAGHCGLIDAMQARPLVAAQVARDQFMARAVEAYRDRGVVLLAGNGHVRRDVGVPRWLSPATRARTLAIGLLEAGDANGDAYDVALVTPVQTRPDPCVAFGAAAPAR